MDKVLCDKVLYCLEQALKSDSGYYTGDHKSCVIIEQ